MRSQRARGAAVATAGLAWLALAGCGTGEVSARAPGGTAAPAPSRVTAPTAPASTAPSAITPSTVAPSPADPAPTDPAPGGVTTGPGGGPCGLGQLGIKLSASTSAKFEESATIVFTDTGTGPCTLSGIPTLRLGGAAGAMPITVLRQPGASRTIGLNPGRQASTRLVWSKYQGQGATCPPFPTSISVTPPGAQAARTLPWIAGISGSVCGGTIKVYPIVAGAGDGA